jgi:putative aldouronate transport system permease protein
MVDGAGRLAKIWHITLPGLKSTIIILLILALGGILGSSFDRPWVLGNNLVFQVSNVLATYIYRTGILGMQFSMTTAVGLFQGLVGVCFVLIANGIATKIGERGLW